MLSLLLLIPRRVQIHSSLHSTVRLSTLAFLRAGIFTHKPTNTVVLWVGFKLEYRVDQGLWEGSVLQQRYNNEASNAMCLKTIALSVIRVLLRTSLNNQSNCAVFFSLISMNVILVQRFLLAYYSNRDKFPSLSCCSSLPGCKSMDTLPLSTNPNHENMRRTSHGIVEVLCCRQYYVKTQLTNYCTV